MKSDLECLSLTSLSLSYLKCSGPPLECEINSALLECVFCECFEKACVEFFRQLKVTSIVEVCVFYGRNASLEAGGVN